MVEENAAADARLRIDVRLEHLRRAALQIEREIPPPLVPQPMGEPVGLDGMEALEVENRLEEAGAGGIPIQDRRNVGAERLADRRILLERFQEGLLEEIGRERPVAEPPGDPVDDRGFEGLVQDRAHGEACQRRFVMNHDLGLAARPVPYRIDRAGDRFHRFRASGARGHDILPLDADGYSRA